MGSQSASTHCSHNNSLSILYWGDSGYRLRAWLSSKNSQRYWQGVTGCEWTGFTTKIRYMLIGSNGFRWTNSVVRLWGKPLLGKIQTTERLSVQRNSFVIYSWLLGWEWKIPSLTRRVLQPGPQATSYIGVWMTVDDTSKSSFLQQYPIRYESLLLVCFCSSSLS